MEQERLIEDVLDADISNTNLTQVDDCNEDDAKSRESSSIGIFDSVSQQKSNSYHSPVETPGSIVKSEKSYQQYTKLHNEESDNQLKNRRKFVGSRSELSLQKNRKKM